jgi:hypothetical protein
MDDPEIMNNVNKAMMAARAENLAILGYNAYRDRRCKEKSHFILEKPDGSETLASYDVYSRTYENIRILKSASNTNKG